MNTIRIIYKGREYEVETQKIDICDIAREISDNIDSIKSFLDYHNYIAYIGVYFGLNLKYEGTIEYSCFTGEGKITLSQKVEFEFDCNN